MCLQYLRRLGFFEILCVVTREAPNMNGVHTMLKCQQFMQQISSLRMLNEYSFVASASGGGLDSTLGMVACHAGQAVEAPRIPPPTEDLPNARGSRQTRTIHCFCRPGHAPCRRLWRLRAEARSGDQFLVEHNPRDFQRAVSVVRLEEIPLGALAGHRPHDAADMGMPKAPVKLPLRCFSIFKVIYLGTYKNDPGKCMPQHL